MLAKSPPPVGQESEGPLFWDPGTAEVVGSRSPKAGEGAETLELIGCPWLASTTDLGTREGRGRKGRRLQAGGGGAVGGD